MRNRILCTIFVMPAAAMMNGQQAAPPTVQSCPGYNWYQSYPWVQSGNSGHTSGDHLTYGTLYGYCNYTSIGQQNCAQTSSSYQVTPWFYTDSQALSNPLVDHYLALSSSGGSAGSNGAQIQTAVTGASEARSCPILLGCTVTITFNATVSGVGATVTFPISSNLGFQPYYPFVTTCKVEPDPTYLMSIAVPPNPGGGSPNQSLTMTATGTYAAGAQSNLNSVATWATSNANVANVIARGGGVASLVSDGSAVITATYQGVSGSATVTVTGSGGGGGGCPTGTIPTPYGCGGGDGDQCSDNYDCATGCCFYGYCENNQDCAVGGDVKSGDPQVSSQIKKMAKQRKGDTNTNLN